MRFLVIKTLAAITIFALVGVAVFAVGLRRYLLRPPFAGDFGLLYWTPAKFTNISKDTIVYIDTVDRVLSVIKIVPKGDGGVGHVALWRPLRRDGNHLIVLRNTDDKETSIEWRRDCIILLGETGVPSYFSVSVDAFQKAIADPQNWEKSVQELIATTMHVGQ
jgi:hypothetical protein